MAGRKSTGTLIDKPAKNSILLGGCYVSLSAIKRATGLSVGYISRIINSERAGRIDAYQKIAAAIGFTIDELVVAVAERKAAMEDVKLQIVTQYETRIRNENAVDNNKRKKGKPVPPRLPGLRLKQD